MVHFVAFAVAAAAMVVSAEPAGVGRAASETVAMRGPCDAAWKKMMATWHEKTGLVYGRPAEKVRSSKGCVNGMFHWGEGKEQDGYGAGMADCALICGTALSGLVDRFAVMGDAGTRADAAKVARGVLNLAKLHGIKGFVARGLCADDAKSICSLSSRDQYTHWVHGLWRYTTSPMADPALAAEYRTLVAEVARFMEERVTPERGWNFGLADGGVDPRGICTMWGPELGPHEDARRPMIYAAAYMATKDRHWLDMYGRCIDEALDRTLRITAPDRSKFLGRMPCYSLYQANVSLELLFAFEKGNEGRRAKIERAMREFSSLAAERAERAMANPGAKPPYGMCWDGELALTMLMTPGLPHAETAHRLLVQAVSRQNLATSGIIRISHIMAACWRENAVMPRSGSAKEDARP